MKRVVLLTALAVSFQLSAFAHCPIVDGGTLVVRAPIGNIHIETTGRDGIDTEVSSRNITVKESCVSRDQVRIEGTGADQLRGNVDWKIVVPRSVNLDLVTYGGSIEVGDLDAAAKVRTTGGSVNVGNIKGQTLIITQGGFIKAGNIGDSAELRSSSAGALEVGNISGDAELHTAGGSITTGTITGKITADTAGGSIYIKGARGEVIANSTTDIYVGDAAKINAKTIGGNITILRVRGGTQGRTESGDIRIESAGAWVEASTGFGTIYVKLVPENVDGDLHMDLESENGDISIFIPPNIKATIDARVDKQVMNAQRIFSDYPVNGQQENVPARNTRIGAIALNTNPLPIPAPSGGRLQSGMRSQIVRNGGGNAISLHVSLGKIEVKKY